MTTRTFAGPTMQDAFRRVRATLGAGAVILDVRHLAGRVEVTAGRERQRGLRRFLEAAPGVRAVPDDAADAGGQVRRQLKA